MTLAFQSGTEMFPRPPAPSQFEAYGFAGVIFASFFFLVCFVILMGGKYFAKRDEVWAQVQEKRDQQLKEALDRRDQSMKEALATIGTSHERVVERVALAAEKTGEASAGVNREMASAMKDLQKEVQASHKVFSEETLYAMFRRVLKELKQDG